MKKIGNKILFLAFVMFGFMMGTRAEDETCSVDDKVRLRNLAAMVSVNYEATTIYGEADENSRDYESGALEEKGNALDVIIRNLDDSMYVIIDSPYLRKDIVADANNKNSKGEIVIRKSNLKQVEQMTFSVYSYEKCTNDALRVINLTIPKSNPNHDLAMCADVPEYYLCQPLITYDIKNVDYVTSIQEYKEKLANQQSKPALENKSDGESGVAGFVSKNKYLIVGIVVAVGIALTVVVLKKRGSAVR